MTEKFLIKEISDKEFKRLIGVRQEEFASGRVRLIMDGAGALHPIEAKYVKPEVHSLMKVDRPEILVVIWTVSFSWWAVPYPASRNVCI